MGTIVLSGSPAAPQVAWLDRVPPALGTLGDNMRVALDMSTRFSVATDGRDAVTQEFVGLDLHKVLSGVSSDWGTLRLQPYAARTDRDGRHDWKLEYRFLDFNLTSLARNRLNLRVGHFEVPYGLEYLVDTNGTLRDTIVRRNLGLKSDWGTSLNGVLPAVEYETALMRGSGNDYSGRGDPFLIAGRVGSPREAALVVGLSAFYGRVQDPDAIRVTSSERAATVVRRTRLGVDAQLELGRFALLAEASGGRDFGRDVANELVELDWPGQGERLGTYVQARSFAERLVPGWTVSTEAVVGARYDWARGWSLSGQFTHDVVRGGRGDLHGTFSLQLRWRL